MFIKLKYWAIGIISAIALSAATAHALSVQLPPSIKTGDVLRGKNSSQLEAVSTSTKGSVFIIPNTGLPSWFTPGSDGLFLMASSTSSNGLAWATASSTGGTGLANLNGLVASTQNFATTSIGSVFYISSSGSTHTFNFPSIISVSGGGTGTNTLASLAVGSNLSISGGQNVLIGTSTTISLGSNVVTSVSTGTAGSIFNSSISSNVLTINIPIASSANTGQLSSTDWSTFNSKVPSTRNINVTSPITGGGALSSDVTIGCTTASSGASGCLSSTDWTTFNNKQAAGNYITALTGDATASGPGSAVLTLGTVNSNTGSFGSSTAIPNFTVNGKGLITAAGTSAVIAPAGTLTGATLASNVLNSSLTSVGTLSALTVSGQTTLGNASTTNLTVSGNSYIGTVVSGVWNGTVLSVNYGGTGTTTSPSIAGQILAADVTGSKYAPTNLVAGSNITITTSTPGQITITASGGSASPGGSNTQLQYNNAGALGGISALTWDGTTLTNTAPAVFATTTVSKFTATQASTTNQSITTNFYLSNIASGNCLQTSTGGLVVGTGSACGSGGGSGNSAWTIANGGIYNATSTDTVSIGTSTPSITGVRLTVYQSTDGAAGQLFFNPNSGTSAFSQSGVANADNFSNSLRMIVTGSNYIQNGIFQPITGILEASTNLTGGLSLNSRASGSTMKFFVGGIATSTAQKMNIDSTGFVGINTTTPIGTLSVKGIAGYPALSVATSSGVQILSIDSNGYTTIANQPVPTFTGQKMLTVIGGQSGGVMSVIRDAGLNISPNQIYGTYDITAYSATTTADWPDLTGSAMTFKIATGTLNNVMGDIAGVRHGNSLTGALYLRPYNNGTAYSALTLTGNTASSTATLKGIPGASSVLTITSSTGATILTINTAQVLVDPTARLTLPQGTAPTLTAAGDIAQDTTNDQLLYGATPNVLTATSTKTITWESPTSSDNITFFQTDVPITIFKVSCVVSSGNSPSVTFSLPHGTSRASPNANLFSSGQSCTATTTPTSYTSFSDNTLAAGEVMIATTSATSLASSTSITIWYKYDRQ